MYIPTSIDLQTFILQLWNVQLRVVATSQVRIRPSLVACVTPTPGVPRAAPNPTLKPEPSWLAGAQRCDRSARWRLVSLFTTAGGVGLRSF